MIGEIEILRGLVARLDREGDRAFSLADRGESAAGMAISFNPAGVAFYQSFIGDSGVRIAAGITEQPSTETRCILVIGGGEGETPAFDCIATAPGMKKLFGKTTGKLGRFRSRYFIVMQAFEANIQLALFQRVGEGVSIDRQVGEIVIETQL